MEADGAARVAAASRCSVPVAEDLDEAPWDGDGRLAALVVRALRRLSRA